MRSQRGPFGRKYTHSHLEPSEDFGPFGLKRAQFFARREKAAFSATLAGWQGDTRPDSTPNSNPHSLGGWSPEVGI